MINTTKKGIARIIIFKEGDTWYGTALEFNIVESGDDPEIVFSMVREAIDGYVESAGKMDSGFRQSTINSALNQTVDPEYELLWNKLEKRGSGEDNLADLPPIYFYGRMSPSAL